MVDLFRPRVTSWLNEQGVDFISFSNLDIRRRKITGEIVALLNFLDSPTDDLSFATFVLGNIFQSVLRKDFPEIDEEKTRKSLETSGVLKDGGWLPPENALRLLSDYGIPVAETRTALDVFLFKISTKLSLLQ